MKSYTFLIAKPGYYDVLDLEIPAKTYAEALGKLVRALTTIGGAEIFCHGDCPETVTNE